MLITSALLISLLEATEADLFTGSARNVPLKLSYNSPSRNKNHFNIGFYDRDADSEYFIRMYATHDFSADFNALPTRMYGQS